MTSIHFDFPVNWLKVCFVTLALFCAGITSTQAQSGTTGPAPKFVASSFVNVPTAITRLEATVIFLKTSLNSLAPHSAAYNQALATLEFNVLILERLKASRDLTNQGTAGAVTFGAQVINTDRFASAPSSALTYLIDLLEI